MTWRSKLWVGILIGLILLVNALTVYYLVQNNKEEALPENSSLFKSPSEIVFRYSGKEVSIFPEQDVFHEIVALNEKRADFTEYFTESTTAFDVKENLYMEYLYEEPVIFDLPLRLENQSLQTSHICFILSGDDGTSFSIETAEETKVVGQLNINTELIEIAKSLV